MLQVELYRAGWVVRAASSAECLYYPDSSVFQVRKDAFEKLPTHSEPSELILCNEKTRDENRVQAGWASSVIRHARE